MARYVWNRPQLPEREQGGGLALGVLLLIGGGATMIWGFSQYDGLGIVGLGAALLSLSILVFSVSLVLREIRQAAFEAALRAGEVATAASKAKSQN